ncbi:hypothetical protein AAFF_G00159330 [Aldrovandia affinis]|uniref:Uncharacterized protein n=1 Tax=Aldrovandia affinis TaxID=143900 RepID=A0AAD7RN16_9TELE|nr:hypothetical protein AAFF_G00159330 [Aldrovandia affinis]
MKAPPPGRAGETLFNSSAPRFVKRAAPSQRATDAPSSVPETVSHESRVYEGVSDSSVSVSECRRAEERSRTPVPQEGQGRRCRGCEVVHKRVRIPQPRASPPPPTPTVPPCFHLCLGPASSSSPWVKSSAQGELSV